MTRPSDRAVHPKGKFRRSLAAIWDLLQALEYGSSGYTFDRIEHLEREVARLKEELRQRPDPGTLDPRSARPPALEY